MSDFAVRGHALDQRRKARSAFLAGMGRGLAGALLFSLPMLMTMEMWQLGFHIAREKLLFLTVLDLPLLVILSHRIGFEETFDWREDVRDAIVAYGIGIAASAAILFLFGLLNLDMPWSEVIGKIAIQAVPATSAPCSAAARRATRTPTARDPSRASAAPPISASCS
jgi:putative integral membrane protein (TIGR02587 family)